MPRPTLKLTAGQLTLSQLRQAYFQTATVQLCQPTWDSVDEGRKSVEKAIEEDLVIYGINTGFGQLAQTRVDSDHLGQLQRNLVLSHCVGVGERLDDSTVALILLLKVNSLARGYSGVRREVIELLLELLDNEIYPAIPAKGSVGASGDLAPLAHLTSCLIGEGEVNNNGKLLPVSEVFAELNIQPLTLRAKEGLALLNGTQVSTALALKGLFEAEINASAAMIAGAMTVDAVLGSVVPFDARVHRVRGQRGQIYCARIYRELLENSELNHSHESCERVQDPYSLRCQPQVMGACLDQMRWVASRLLIEANAVTDNPLVFSANDEILSGGNFHAEPVAFAADILALAVAEMGALSERRIALLIDANLSQLPPFLVKDAGVNSGFMIAHVTAASLASENKSLAHPASVDSLPTSANQEDHVSMATFGSRRLQEMNANTRNIVAIELLAAAQGVSLRRPLQTSPPLEKAHALIRENVEPWVEDRYFAIDIEQVYRQISERKFMDWVVDFIDSVTDHG